jgi:hypothetical protein
MNKFTARILATVSAVAAGAVFFSAPAFAIVDLDPPASGAFSENITAAGPFTSSTRSI